MLKTVWYSGCYGYLVTSSQNYKIEKYYENICNFEELSFELKKIFLLFYL